LDTQSCPSTCEEDPGTGGSSAEAGAGGASAEAGAGGASAEAGAGGGSAEAGAGGAFAEAGAGGGSATCNEALCAESCPETCPEGTACVEFFRTAVTTQVWYECRPNPCGAEPTCACSDVASLCTPAESSQPLMCIGESSTPGAVIVCGFQGDCAAPDTPIATPSGERPIASLEVGDLVYSVHDDALVAVPLVLVNRKRVFEHRVVEVTL
jgi:hypothetical protein